MERETITRRRLSDEVADRLERLIHSGEFELGDKLPSERDLMERFSVDQRRQWPFRQIIGVTNI